MEDVSVETRPCAHCGRPVPQRAAAGRPFRYCRDNDGECQRASRNVRMRHRSSPGLGGEVARTWEVVDRLDQLVGSLTEALHSELSPAGVERQVAEVRAAAGRAATEGWAAVRAAQPAGDPVGDMIDDAQDVEGPADPTQDTGLIALRGPNLFSGYWPDRTGGPDADGWFRTPDIGFLDPSGDLHLVDRSTDLVVVSGFTVYPHEIERVLLEMPAVVEAAVVGVPDEKTGQAVRAVVVRAPAADPVDADAVRAHCSTRLARFKVPAQVVFVDALPRTPSGKLARKELAGGDR